MIEVEELRKQFVVRRGRLRRERHVVDAVNGISFRVERGELLGYLGPNGAGKSTTIKMLTGILVPSGGRVSVAGLDPSRKRSHWRGPSTRSTRAPSTSSGGSGRSRSTISNLSPP